MSTNRICVCATLALLTMGMTALADWDPQDGHKMHWPQNPDPLGWDVCLNHGMIADDFQCSETGPITDVHFWVSWQDDNARWDLIQNIDITLFSDSGGNVPGAPLQGYSIVPTDPEFSYRFAGSGSQGWHCPSTPYTEPQDHANFYQINLNPLDQPWFHQTMGTRYWLGISIGLLPDGDQNPANDPQIGWKTALVQDHFGSNSKWRLSAGPWLDVMPAGFGVDQAFVITPEPGAAMLLTIGAMGLITCRRR